jgi:hypothetical protein
MSNDASTNTVPVFSGKNFREWSSKMVNLVEKDLDLVIGIDAATRKLAATAPELSAHSKEGLSTRNNIKAQAKISAYINSEVQALIGAESASSAHSLWRSLTNHYRRSSSTATVAAVKKLSRAELGKDSILTYVANIKNAAQDLSEASDVIFPDKIISAFVLAGLPEEYESVGTALDSHSGDPTADVTRMLLNN